jgi:putative nucleotidyltransferase with HDIG domain
MSKLVRAYVLMVAVIAAGTVLCLKGLTASVNAEALRAGAAFAVLGLVCQSLMHPMNRGAGGTASGTISFIPFVTAGVMAPNWLTPLLVCGAVALDEVRRRREPLKAIFNISQHALAAATSIAGFLALGGVSLRADESFRAPSYIAALFVFLAVNTGLVSGVLALASGRKLMDIWRPMVAGTVVYDLAASPLVYIFAVVYNRFTLAGTILLILVLLGARQLYKTNRQLEHTNQELLEVMVGAIELRDPYTSGHSQRVAEYSTIIARALGLSNRDIDRVRVAALLHDVGKIDQRFAAILQKPGRLTEEERAIIELHPVISADLVSRVSSLADIVTSVRHHHERWDGAGYPGGVSGERIPLFARIITFADTIDAMTTDRPYRPALGPEAVRAELLRNRGKQFDPGLCDRLLASPLFQRLFDDLGQSGGRAEASALNSFAA